MSTKLKCLLLDDELPALSYLKLLCTQISDVEVVRAFNNPAVFTESAPELDFNTCILDIQMPGLSGLEIAEKLEGKLVIFTTAHKEYAADAFDLEAVDYIRKPIEIKRFETAIAKAKQILENSIANASVLWNTDKGKMIIYFNKIYLITTSETDSRDKIILFENGEHVTVKNLSFEQILNTIPSKSFCRINKKEILAIKYISSFTSENISTSILHKDRLPTFFTLSEAYINEFRRRLKV